MNVLIADDHELVRKGLRLLINRLEPNSNISEAESYRELETLTNQEPGWDLIIIDLTMPGADPLQGVQLAMENAQSTPIVVISASDKVKLIKGVLALGVKGFIPKSASAELMGHAIKLVLAGGCYFPEFVLDIPVNDNSISNETLSEIPNISGLTKRQSDVATLLAKGMANKEIGRGLNMSEATVRTHMTAIFRVLNVNNRTQAVIAISKLAIQP